ncbi:MAG: CPBP family intramembrane metalloprotease [Spirochaetia bacterium]|nr:CPBP family intramembrane metalloprotease [Spirochaetia bacterium]
MEKIQDKQKQAGLLFRLIGRHTQIQISKFLNKDEVRLLARSFESYQKSTREERRRIELNLHNSLRRDRKPAVLFTVLMVLFSSVLILHNILFSNLNLIKRVELFMPLFLGACSPLAAYLIPAYRLRILFSINLTYEKWAFTFITFLALLWIIIYIRIEETLPAGNLPFFSLIILSLAAVSAPFAEEILFREAFPSLIGKYPYYTGHLVSSVFFSIAHLPVSPYMAFLYLLSALFLSILRVNSDSLLYPWAAHSTANLISLYI